MNDEELKKLFSNTEASEPSPDAKNQALSAALTEFRAMKKEADASDNQAARSANSTATENTRGIVQGIVKWLRPTVKSTVEARGHTMNTTTHSGSAFSFSNHKWQIAGVSTVSVMFLAVMLANIENTEYELQRQGLTESDLASAPEFDTDHPARLEDLGDDGGALEMKREVGTLATEPLADRFILADRVDNEIQPKFQLELGGNGLLMELEALNSEPRSDFAKPGRLLREHAPMSSLRDVGRDRFSSYEAHPIKSAATDPISTLSIDVDTASYSYVRRQLNQGKLPKTNAVRVEEMLNYFDYDYPVPTSADVPFSTFTNVVDSPWRPGNKLVHIGIKGFEIAPSEVPNSNIVFLLDVSGSMRNYDKLPLVKQSMELLLSQLKPDDTVSIAVYAGAAGVVLEPTPVREKATILASLQRLEAGGGTAGGEGLKLAYELAKLNYRDDAINRVILATDGDFNVGMSSSESLKDYVSRKRDEGIYLSVLGFGQGNLNDSLMQTLAQNGNGVAAYIDTLSEAQKVLVDQATSMLFPIAKDVKIQIEFNPSTVSEYRLIGYETRNLKNEDFANDKVDAGDIGAGHTVTAIYEITPVQSDSGLRPSSRYAETERSRHDPKATEYGYLNLRYKLPDDDVSQLISQPIMIDAVDKPSESLNRETNFATAVAGFGQLLMGGKYTGNWNFDNALELAQANKGKDPYGYRTEFVQLIRKAKLAQNH